MPDQGLVEANPAPELFNGLDILHAGLGKGGYVVIRWFDLAIADGMTKHLCLSQKDANFSCCQLQIVFPHLSQDFLPIGQCLIDSVAPVPSFTEHSCGSHVGSW